MTIPHYFCSCCGSVSWSQVCRSCLAASDEWPGLHAWIPKGGDAFFGNDRSPIDLDEWAKRRSENRPDPAKCEHWSLYRRDDSDHTYICENCDSEILLQVKEGGAR